MAHISTKSICPKVNVVVGLQFELAYFKSAVSNFS